MEINKILSSTNIAESLSEEQLVTIGKEASEGFDVDKTSRAKWEEATKEWMKLALQVTENKTFPWQGASNVKYPLVATAGMQFAARAYPTLVPSDGQVVKCQTIGSDPQGQKALRARRISTHMSYQLMTEMEEWEEDMDKLLLIMPIIGVAFKKTYYDSTEGRNYSCLVHSDNLVVNYWTSSLEASYRISEIFYLTEREVRERVLNKIFLDVKLGDPQPILKDEVNDTKLVSANTGPDKATPYTFIEQHTYLDLDNDGYSEPYIITLEHASKKVVRIVARFREEGVKTDDSGNITKIQPLHFYTKFPCIPNPDGSFYDIGFGHLLGPLNESVNTLINQLIDSGSLNNLQSGFIGKGLKIRMSDQRFSPGEWKSVNNTADDLRKNIFPLPTKEPSNVLFQLLGMLIQSGKELASVAEIFVGKMPGQNTPAYTTQQSIEQGMKLFTAIYKRIYRSLTKEFRKLYDLNALYLDEQAVADVLDEPAQIQDYSLPNNDVLPAADPSASSSFEKQQKAQQLMQILQIGTLNPMEVTMRYLQAGEYENPEKLILQQPPPNPEQQKMQMEAQMKQQEMQMKMQIEQQKASLKEREMALKQQETMLNMKWETMRNQLAMEHENVRSNVELQNSQKEADAQMLMAAQQHQLSMQQQEEAHQQKLQVQKEQAKQKEKQPNPKK